MHSLETVGAAKLKTHFRCGMLFLLSFFGGIGFQLLNKDVKEERKGTNIGENTVLYSFSSSRENLCFRIVRALRCLCCQARLHQSMKNGLNKERRGSKGRKQVIKVACWLFIEHLKVLFPSCSIGNHHVHRALGISLMHFSTHQGIIL
jgi:hypothetical protein